MRVIEVMGPGCANCKRVEATVREVVERLGIEAEIRKIVHYPDIIGRGVMSTPGLAIDGRVVSVGRIPTREQVEGWLVA
ncbi:MAG TPA: thioredoxin family protein [Gammaproteobacteria bacterium]|nr:thioredoxin family protein [Gammaproteobacteria bacterium]